MFFLTFFAIALDNPGKICYNHTVAESNAAVAQSVEHILGKDEVISSILISSSKRRVLRQVRPFWFFGQKCSGAIGVLENEKGAASALDGSLILQAVFGKNCA